MKNIFKFIPVLAVTALYPFVASAQFFVSGPRCFSSGGIGFLICRIHQILNSVVPLLVALGVVYFVWGVVQYVIRSDEEAKKSGRNRMIWGIIGLAVIIGVWGLVYLVVNTFGLYAYPPTPTLVPLAPDPSGVDSSCGKLGSNSKLQNVLGYVTCLIGNSVIPFLFAIAVVMFVWGVIQYFLLNPDEEKKRTQGKMFMIWGIIALVVMMSIWSLVAIVGGTFGFSTGVLPSVSPTKVSPSGGR